MRKFTGFFLIMGMLSGSVAFAEVDKKTERLWKAKCSSCHGTDGKAETEKGKQMKVRDMTQAAYQKGLTDEQIKKSLLEGINKTEGGVKQEMEPYKDELKPEQIDALVKMVRQLGGK